MQDKAAKQGRVSHLRGSKFVKEGLDWCHSALGVIGSPGLGLGAQYPQVPGDDARCGSG